MKLRNLALVGLLGLSTTAAFAANTATVNVTATVSSVASINGMPASINFGTVDPTFLSGNSVTSSSTSVTIFNNAANSATTVATTCGKTDASGKGCYICTGAECTVGNNVLLSCNYTPCGTGASAITVTPGANTAAGTGGFQTTIPAANSTPDACTVPGSFTCTMNSTNQLNNSGAYTGNVALTVSAA